MIKQLLFAVAVVVALATSAIAQTTPAATTNASAVIATGNTFQTLLPANQGRRSLTVENNNVNGDSCWITVDGGTPSKAAAILLLPGGSYTRYFPYIPPAAIQGTCATTSDTIYVDYQ